MTTEDSFVKYRTKSPGALEEDAYAIYLKHREAKGCRHAKPSEGSFVACTAEKPCHALDGGMCMYLSFKHVPLEKLTGYTDVLYNIRDKLYSTKGLKGNMKKNAFRINLENIVMFITGCADISELPPDEIEAMGSFARAIDYVKELKAARSKQAQMAMASKYDKTYRKIAKKPVYHNKNPESSFTHICEQIMMQSKPYNAVIAKHNELLPDEKYHRNGKNTKSHVAVAKYDKPPRQQRNTHDSRNNRSFACR